MVTVALDIPFSTTAPCRISHPKIVRDSNKLTVIMGGERENDRNLLLSLPGLDVFPAKIFIKINPK